MFLKRGVSASVAIVVLTAASICAVSAASLSVTTNIVPTGSIVNLTTEGTSDWVHWGLVTGTSIDRKTNVAPRISNFIPVNAPTGYVYIYQYSDNYNGYSWSDGTPDTAVANTPTGVWAYGVPAAGTGFRFSVPASTSVQVLKVYVGAFAAKGKFVAYLSDSSAPGYTNNTLVNNMSNGRGGVFGITFAANSGSQTLNIIWTLETEERKGTGNVTLQAAALNAPGANNLPFVALTSPEDRASFASANTLLTATAGDADGTIAAVEFYAGAAKIGEARTSPYTMTWTNPAPGSYVLTARAIDDKGGIGTSTPVAVFVNGSGGTLSGTRSNSLAAANLTAEGTSDWAHWGALTASSFNHKATGNSQISNFTIIGTDTPTRFTDNFTAFSWSDGTPIVATNGSKTGIYVNSVTNGFEISVPADLSRRRLSVYVGLYGVQANFEAFLSDFSGRAFTDTTLSNVFGNRYVVYTIDYSAASVGQRLIVRHTVRNVYDFTYGNVTLQAATLQTIAPPPTNAPPLVVITDPTNNAVFTAAANVSLTASASDPDGSVTQVQFFNGTTLIDADITSPYTAAISNLAAGTYTLFAVATDNRGAKATNTINITVNALPPSAVTLKPASVESAAFQFSFGTESSRNYVVEWANTIPATNWQVLTNVVGNNAEAFIQDTTSGGDQRFYRVGVQ